MENKPRLVMGYIIAALLSNIYGVVYAGYQKKYQLMSPDKTILLTVNDHKMLGKKPKVKSIDERSVLQEFNPVVP